MPVPRVREAVTVETLEMRRLKACGRLWRITCLAAQPVPQRVFTNLCNSMQATFRSSGVKTVGRGSSVGKAFRCGLDSSGIESRWGARFSALVRTGPGAQAMGTESLPVLKRPGRGVDHSPLVPRLMKE